MKIECSSHAQHDRNCDFSQMSIHPELLLGTTETDPEQIRPRRFDLPPDLLFFRCRQRTKRRAAGAGNLKCRILLPEFCCQPLRDAVPAAQKEMPPVSLDSISAGLQKKRGAGNPLYRLLQLPAQRFRHGDSVRINQRRPVDGLPDCFITE